MYNCTAQRLFLGIILAFLFSSFSLTNADGIPLDDREAVYNVTTKLIDDIKESTFTIKLKCRPRTFDILTCSLYDPEYEITYNKKEDSSRIDEPGFSDGSSYVGNFEIKFRRSIVEQLTVSSSTSLKQLSFYRIMANLLFLGVDVNEKSEGTFSMTEQSVYGKCAVLVKIAKNLQFDGGKKAPHQTFSVKRTRNLETCYPVPGLLIYDAFLYHPTMTSVHYDIKSSISRFIVSSSTFTSYMTEDVAVKRLDGGGNTTMLHIRTTLTQHSLGHTSDPYPVIIDPVYVKLPFVDGFDPLNKSDNKTDMKLQISNPEAMASTDSKINTLSNVSLDAEFLIKYFDNFVEYDYLPLKKLYLL